MTTNAALLPQLFVSAGNVLQPIATGFKTTHEPVHSSQSGGCVNIDTEKNLWHCHSCQEGGDAVKAMMSLHGRSLEEARAHLATLTGAPEHLDHTKSQSQASALVALAEDIEFWHDPEGNPWATIRVGAHREHWPIGAKAFKRYLARHYYLRHGKTPGGQGLQDAIHVLEGQAIYDGNEHAVYIRLAAVDDRLYLDMANSAWGAVEVTPEGWRMVHDPPVKFRRARGMLPFPEPIAGTSLCDLRPFLNVSEDDFILAQSWLVSAFAPRGPYAFLELHGEQGSAKSTTARVLRKLIDPSTVPLRRTPRDERDLMISAGNNWLLAYDNLSYLPKWLSDALCSLSTGAGFATRELHTDREEALFSAQRPVLLNGIEDLARESDLVDRTIALMLPRLSDGEFIPEDAFWPLFDRLWPQFFGALLGAVATALQRHAEVRLNHLPRMADFARWAAAATPSLGITEAEFLQIYSDKSKEARRDAMDTDVLAQPIQDLVGQNSWEGTASELLDALDTIATDRVKKAQLWPKTPQHLSNALRRLAPLLRSQGYKVTWHERTKNSRPITLERAAKAPSSASSLPPKSSNRKQLKDLLDDAGGDAAVTLPGRDDAERAAPLRPASPSASPPNLPDHKGIDSIGDTDDDDDAHLQNQSRSLDDADCETGSRAVIQEPSQVVAGATPIEVRLAADALPIEYVTTASQLDRLLPAILASPILGIDTETTGLDPLQDRLRLVQLALPDRTLVVDAFTCPIQRLAPVLRGAQTLVFHNAKFDLKFLIAAGLPWPTATMRDTMIGAQLLGAGAEAGLLKSCGLQQVAERHLGLTLDKSEQRSDWSGALSPQQLRYAAQDAAVLLKLATALSRELETAELARVADIEYSCIPALAWLELAGLPVDGLCWRKRAGIEKHRAAALEAQLHTIVTPSADHGLVTVNWRSAQQVKNLLLARGHRVQDTASSTLNDLPDEDPLIPTLLAFRDASKRAGTYGETWLEKHLHPVTGRIHADYLQLGAMSGRMSCTKPNVQNLPRSAEYRGSIRPEPGRCLIKADFSQIELRLAAIIAGENAMISAFQSGQDLHTVTAARLLGTDLAAVTKDHRQLAKALNFGLLYGMGAERLQAYARQNYKVTMSPREAAMHRRRFFDAYPDLKRWHQKRSAELRNAASIETRTMTGRRRLNTSRYTEILNTPVQGTGADGLKAALGRLFVHRHEVPEARLVACVHDEVVAECPIEAAEQTAQWLNSHMTTAMRDIVGDAVPIVAETMMGQDWYGTPLTEREVN